VVDDPLFAPGLARAARQFKAIAAKIAVQFKALAPYRAEFSLTPSVRALQLRVCLGRE
jgi:hypothetical protein